MKSKEFNQILNQQLEKCKDVLSAKNKEYSAGGDRLSNFKVASMLQSEHPLKSLLGMMTKHTVSISDMINDVNHDQRYPEIKDWDEKITDSINYLILMKALVLETDAWRV